MGLGDHILCNAIIRNYAKLNDKIYLFVKPHNHKNVSFMYRDLKNIDYIIGDDYVAQKYIIDNNITNLLKVGFDKLDISRYKFDESFYRCINMDFNKKWTDFYLERDLKKEKQVFESFNVVEGEYIFVQEDRNRGFTLDKSKIRTDLPLIYSDVPIDFFDLCYIIEKAKEVHLMESSFKCLIDFLDNEGDLFFHRYVRKYPTNIECTSRKKWTIFN